MNLNAKNKKAFFIIGSPGTGKTILAEIIRKKITGKVLFFDDLSYIRKVDTRYINIYNRVKNCKYTQNKTIVTTHHTPFINYSPFLNKNCVWIIINTTSELIENYSIPHYCIRYLNNAWNDLVERRRTTRPCIIISRNDTEPKLEYNLAIFSKNRIMEL